MRGKTEGTRRNRRAALCMPALAALVLPLFGAAAPAALSSDETLSYDGVGDTVLQVDVHEEPRVATFSHNGSSNFAVWAVGSQGENQDLLVNTIGPYEGTVLYNDLVGEELAALDISADGAWEVALEPLDEADTWPEDGDEASGNGDDVLVLEWDPDGLTILDLSHSGDSNFAIWAYTDGGRDLIVNTIGPYEGQARLSAGSVLLAITSEGDWTLTR